MLGLRELCPARLVLGLAFIAAVVPLHEAAPQARQRPLPQVAYQRLDSLERAALTSPTFAERLHAVGTIASIAIGQGDCVRGPAPSAVRYPGLVSRLAAIYRQSQDAALRHVILDRMLWQVECPEVVSFLVEAAEEAPSERAAPAGVVHDEVRASTQSHAVDVLVALGPRGEPTLRRLHAQGTVRDSTARASLESLSRQGFRRPERR